MCKKFVEEARELGWELSSVSDLNCKGGPRYPELIPLLVDWLDRVDEVPQGKITFQRGLFNALCVREARRPGTGAGAALARKVRELGPGYGLQQSAAIALSFAADESCFDEVAELIQDESLGVDRAALVDGLARAGGEKAVPILRSLIAVEVVGNRVVKPLGRLGTPDDVPLIEPFLDSEYAWVRKHAAKAIESLSSGAVAEP